jgi:hypothetical protein
VPTEQRLDSVAIADLNIRVKWILLNKGLAATSYLVQRVEENRGKFKNNVREYQLPTKLEIEEAYEQAFEELREGDWADYILRNQQL